MSDEFKITRYIENEPPRVNKNLVEVVRCGECKYDGTWMCPWRNTQVPRYPSADDFCSYGEREGE